MLDAIKSALRVSTNDPGITMEIQDLMDACRLDLIQSGVSKIKANDEEDALIKRAITVYCKGNYGYDNPDADRFNDSYVMLKQHLSLAGDYRESME